MISGEQGCLRTRLNPSSALRMASFRNHQKPILGLTRPVVLLDALVDLFRSEMISCMGSVMENFVYKDRETVRSLREQSF